MTGKMFVLDSHCDTPTQIFRTRKDMSVRSADGHVDFPRLKEGGVDASFFALYLPADMNSEQAWDYAREMLEVTKREVERHPDMASFAFTGARALANKEKGLLSIMLGLENASAIGSDMARLEWFRSQGIRYITLCHNADNLVCDSAAGTGMNGGLSTFGKKLVRKMNEEGMLIDCAHISDKAFYDVLDVTQRAVVSTHSCCRALAGHRRNMSDDMLRALAGNGGVIQINFYPVFLQDGCSDNGPSCPYTRIGDHIDHAVDVAGIDHVGIGSDFDGIDIAPDGMEDVSMVWKVFEDLQSRGYSDADIAKIAGGNFLRVLDD